MARTADRPDDSRSMRFREVVTPRVLVCYVLIALGIFFFWVNRGTQTERAGFFLSVMQIYPHPDMYCDIGIVLAWMDDDWNGIDTRKKCPSCPCVEVPFNYAKGVLWLGRLGFHVFSVADRDWLAPMMIVVFLLLTAVVFEATRYWHALYYGLLLLNPAVFLALERANLDVGLYCCAVAAVLLSARYGEGCGYGIVFFASTLKIYPFVGVLAFLRPTRRSWYYLFAAAGGMILFLILTWDYLPFGRIPGSSRISWGYPVIFDLTPDVLRNLGWPELGKWVAAFTPRQRLIVFGSWCALAAVVAWYARRPLASFLKAERTSRRQFLLLGCSIYSFCFATGISFEYRSVFILLMAPYFLLAAEGSERWKRNLARFGECLVLAVFILPWLHSYDPFVPIQHACYWLLFGFCAVLSVAELFNSFPARNNSFLAQTPHPE